MKTSKFQLLKILTALASFLLPLTVFAEDLKLVNPITATVDGHKVENVIDLIALISATFPPGIGAAAFVMVIIAAFFFVTAAGSDEKIERGQTILAWTAVGIAVVFMSYVIIRFVLLTLVGGSGT